MIYEYSNIENSKDIIEVEMKMTDKHPNIIEQNGKVYQRLFKCTVKIPEYMKAGQEFKFNYSKSPSGKKHYF